MKISKQPTNHILVKAHTDSECDGCDFATISCGGEWAEQMTKRLTAARPFNGDGDFSSLQYYDCSAAFYRSTSDDTESILPEGRDWAFVELDEGEEDGFKEPESRLNCYMSVLYKNGKGLYKAYGKHTGDEFYTAELPLSKIVERILKHHLEAETLVAGCTALYDLDKKHLTIRVFGWEIFSGDISGREDDFWYGDNIDGREFDFNLSSNDEREHKFNLAVYAVRDGKTDTGHLQTIPLAFNPADDIENLLRTVGTDELCLSDADTPICVSWRNDHGASKEGKVLCVGYDNDNDLYLKVEDNCGGDISLWESNGHLSGDILERVRELVIERMEERLCSECGRPVFEGFIVWGGDEYYCSEECLHKHYSPEEWTKMSAGPEGKEGDGNNECYWTEWWSA